MTILTTEADKTNKYCVLIRPLFLHWSFLYAKNKEDDENEKNNNGKEVSRVRL
jgi:hypothetical protein